MATNSGGPDRGTGPDKETTAGPEGLEAPLGSQNTEPSGSNAADPAKGGCMKFGWGCLPVLAAVGALPYGLSMLF